MVVVWMSCKLHIHMLQVTYIERGILVKEHIKLTTRTLQRVTLEPLEHTRTMLIKHLQPCCLCNKDPHIIESGRTTERLVQRLCHTEDFAILPWTALLSRSVPIALRFIDRRYIRNVVALIHQMLGHIHKIVCICVITIFAEVGFIFCRGISLAVLGIMYKRRVREKNEIITSALFCSLHEKLMTCTFTPIIALAIQSHIRLRSTLIRINISSRLFQGTCTKVHSPNAQTDSHRIAGSICLL